MKLLPLLITFFLIGCEKAAVDETSKEVKFANTIRSCVADELQYQSYNHIDLIYFSPVMDNDQYYLTFEVDDKSQKNEQYYKDGYRNHYRAGLLSSDAIRDIQNNNYVWSKNLAPRYRSASKVDQWVIDALLTGDKVNFDRDLGFGCSNRVALHDQKSIVLTSGNYLIEFLHFPNRGDQMKRVEEARQVSNILDRSIKKCLK